MRGRIATVGIAVLVLLAGGCARCKRAAYAGWGRDRWQQPERVVETLGIVSGQRIADLGAGGGYFTFRLAEAVGDSGLVYAVDVDADMTGYLEARVAEEGVPNVEVVLAEYDDPLLPDAGVDLIFTCNTYHHLEDRPAYFARVRRALRPGGRVAIVEYEPRGWLQRVFPHSTPTELIRDEMARAGYRLEGEHDFLDRQSFLIFARGEAPHDPAPAPGGSPPAR